jgi:hypothetical protein
MDAASAAAIVQELQMLRRKVEEMEDERDNRENDRDARDNRQDRRPRQILDRRTALTVRLYNGNPGEWRDWSMCFKRCLRSMEDVVYKTMNTIEGAAVGDIDEDVEFSGAGDDDAIRRKRLESCTIS